MGRVFLNQAFFWSLPFRLIDPLCHEFFLAWVSDYLGERELNTELGWVAVLERGWSLTGAVLFSSWVFTCIFKPNSDIACLARERDGRAECAGKKRKKSLSCFQARPCIRMPLFLLTTSSSGLFRQKMVGVPPLSHFLGESPRDEVVLPKHRPHIDSTLHWLGGVNIRSQTE